MRTSSLFAISPRAIATASQLPRSIASRMSGARWNPPVTITGIDTASLIRPASSRLAASSCSGVRLARHSNTL